MHLIIELLPHFKKQKSAVIMNVSSVLGFLPTSVIYPVYNGTKAWVRFWSMNLRTQLKGTSVRVVEIVPPTVATDLHREKQDPDHNKEKNKATLSVDEFMADLVQGWEERRDTTGAGMVKGVVERWHSEFGGDYEKIDRK